MKRDESTATNVPTLSIWCELPLHTDRRFAHTVISICPPFTATSIAGRPSDISAISIARSLRFSADISAPYSLRRVD